MRLPATDVVVIGAGAIGTGAAYDLAKAGLRVTVVDRRGIGQEASGANVGLVTVFSAHSLDEPDPGPSYALTMQSADAYLTLGEETGVDIEKESNNTPAEANPLNLGRKTKGSIVPLGEQDHFKLTIPGSNRSVLTFAMEGRPYIRTSVSLTDQAGKAILSFDPNRVTGRQAEFSWLVDPGEYLARVTEPPASIVLIWDTSGSMGEDSVKNLKIAVEAYLDQVQPTERYNLIRFSGGGGEDKDVVPVEVLLPEFTSDRTRLKAVVATGNGTAGAFAPRDQQPEERRRQEQQRERADDEHI